MLLLTLKPPQEVRGRWFEQLRSSFILYVEDQRMFGKKKLNRKSISSHFVPGGPNIWSCHGNRQPETIEAVCSNPEVPLPSEQVQKKWDQNDKADPEKQPALEENDLKPTEGETQHR